MTAASSVDRDPLPYWGEGRVTLAPDGFSDISEVLTEQELAAMADAQHRLTDADVRE